MQRSPLTRGPELTPAAAGATAGACATVASAPAWSTRSHLDILAIAVPLHSSSSRQACIAFGVTIAAAASFPPDSLSTLCKRNNHFIELYSFRGTFNNVNVLRCLSILRTMAAMADRAGNLLIRS